MINLKNKIAALLSRAGVSANFMTCLGLLLAASSGFLIYRGLFLWAGVFLFLSGLTDLLDGAIARQTESKNPFGGILDSSLDRYGDGFVYGGAIFYCTERGYMIYAILAFSALLGSFLISYVRARTECVPFKCRVGFWERGERLVYLTLGLVFGNLALVLGVLGVATHGTALQRLYYAKHLASGGAPRGAMQRKGVYFIQILALFLLVLLFRVPFSSGF